MMSGMALRAFRGYTFTELSQSNGVWDCEKKFCVGSLRAGMMLGMALRAFRGWLTCLRLVCKTFLCNLSDSKSYFFINYFYKDFFNHII